MNDPLTKTAWAVMCCVLAGCSNPPTKEGTAAKESQPPVRRAAQPATARAPAGGAPKEAVAQARPSGAAPAAPAPAPVAPAPAPRPVAPVPPPRVERDYGDSYQQKLREIYQHLDLEQKENKFLSGEYLKVAQRLYGELSYREAVDNLKLALQHDPANLEAQELLERILWLLGDREGSIHDVARKMTQERTVAIEMGRIEMQRLFDEGVLFKQQQEFDKSLERFQQVMEVIKYSPYYLDDRGLESQTVHEIEETKRLQRIKDLKYKESMQRGAIENAEFERQRDVRYVQAKIHALFSAALERFNAKRYAQCEELCREVLTLDPGHTQAETLKKRAARNRHLHEAVTNLTEYNHQVRAQIESVEASQVPYMEIFRFPTRAEWDVIRQRKPPFQELFTEETSSAAKHINIQLDTRKVTLNFEQTRFQDAIQFLREITGLNFVVSQKAQELIADKDLNVSLRLKEIRLKDAIKLILDAHADLIVKIKHDVLYITTKADEKAELFLHFYDVSDIVNDLPDFPAPNLALTVGQSQGAGFGGTQIDFGDEGEGGKTTGTGIGIEKLKELINAKIGENADEGSVASSAGGILIVRKPLEAHKKIQKLLTALRKTVGIMVTVEARFIDIQDNFLESLGVDFRGLPGVAIQNVDGAGTSRAAGYQFMDAQRQNDTRASIINRFSSGLGSTTANPFNITSAGGIAAQYNLTTVSTFQIQAILEAVQKTQQARQVSAPRVTVFNTQRSHVMSINQEAYIKDVEIEQTNSVLPVLTPVIDVLNSGSLLEARPTVSHDRKYIMLEVKPTLAVNLTTAANTVQLDLSSGNTNVPIELPVLRVQKIRTTVLVPDGGTVLVGGLKDFRNAHNKSGIPLIQKIPLINVLAKREGSSNLRRSVVVLLKASITIAKEEEEKLYSTHLEDEIP